MRTRIPKVTLAVLIALVWPGYTFAAPPTPVTGLAAAVQGEAIVLTWDASASADISAYTIYFAQESIIESGGEYDDFEKTSGPVTTYTLVSPYTSGTFYVAVLAVNAAGEESLAFTEEVKVDLSGGAVPEAPLPTSLPMEEETTRQNADTLQLLSAEVKSPTQIVLRFSSSIEISVKDAPRAFRIVGPDDVLLPIREMLVEGNVATVTTETQKRGVVYEVKLTEPLRGTNGSPLDPVSRSAFFTGHVGGQEPPPPPPPCALDPLNPPPATNLTLEPQAQPDGLYTVTARWVVDTRCGEIMGFLVFQTLDGGQSFQGPDVLPAAIGGAMLRNVPAGYFGLAVYTINAYGYPSQAGAFSTVPLPLVPGAAFPTYPFQGAVILEPLPLSNGATIDALPEQQPFPVTVRELPEGHATPTHMAAPLPGTTIDPVRLAMVLGASLGLMFLVAILTIAARRAVRRIVG